MGTCSESHTAQQSQIRWACVKSIFPLTKKKKKKVRLEDRWKIKYHPRTKTSKQIPPGDASVSDRAAYPGGGRCVCSGAGGTCNREGKLLKNLDLIIRLPVYGCRAWYGGGDIHHAAALQLGIGISKARGRKTLRIKPSNAASDPERAAVIALTRKENL
ncbi:hypothetical protein WA026_010635 [Henosepilachna vigintioctopunctata]|uniref:Uncharacterized protein n=1 Tax=Henosepilachna vigintioctopunctata TaxID=420089 RepID=A0AAW1VAU1_9CUCU